MRKIFTIFVVLTLVLCFSSSALADLVLADGMATGQWFNPQRGGEGFFVEIIDTGAGNQISIAMFTYDANGEQLWVMGNVVIDANDEVIAVPVFKFDGPVWGPGYDAGDLNTTPFGTITARFPTCDTALFGVTTEVGLQNGSYSLVRLTDIEGIECTDPPAEPAVTPGTWRGERVCFNVAADGRSLTEINSQCDGSASFDSNLKGISDDLEECDVEAECDGPWSIEGGVFNCTSELGTLAIGKFGSSNSASGSAFEQEGGIGDYCTALWSATPD